MQKIAERTARFTDLFGGTLPIMNAPMAGAATPEMAAAVSNAGGLGVLAGDWLSAAGLKNEITRVRELTDRPFAVNLRAKDKVGASRYFDTPEHQAAARRVAAALSDLAVDCGLPADYEQAQLPDFEEQLEVVIACNVPLVTVAFGGLREEYADALESKGVVVLGAATTLREAKVMRSAGVAGVIVQGVEAGGPRLNFERDDDASLVGLMSLIGPAARATQLPVVASGGIMTGAQMAAALTAGASAVMLGTALLRTPESAAHPAHKAILPYTDDSGTVLTRVVNGRLTRVVENGLIEAMRAAGLQDAAYPCQWLSLIHI